MRASRLRGESVVTRSEPVTADRATQRRSPGAPVPRILTTDTLGEWLTADILSGRIPAGSHLAEVELAESYGVSRQTLRLALGQLVHSGLLRREAHRGSWVAQLDEDDLRDLYGFRELIEVEAARRLAENPQDLEPLESAVSVLKRLRRDASWDEVSAADFGFHRALVLTFGSVRRSRAHEQLCNETRLSLVPVKRYRNPRYMYEEHADILRTLRAGDPDAAEARIRRHLDLGLSWLVEDLERPGRSEVITRSTDKL